VLVGQVRLAHRVDAVPHRELDALDQDLAEHTHERPAVGRDRAPDLLDHRGRGVPDVRAQAGAQCARQRRQQAEAAVLDHESPFGFVRAERFHRIINEPFPER